MLEDVPTFQADHRVYRFANVIDFESMLGEMGLDAGDVDEILELLGEMPGGTDGERLLDAPFAPKPQLEARKTAATRFSDGSLRVFYSSLESETAELEVVHWYADAAVGGSRRVAYYNRIRCRFRGYAADLRPRARDWPFLIDDGNEAYALPSVVQRRRRAAHRRLAYLFGATGRRNQRARLPTSSSFRARDSRRGGLFTTCRHW